MKIFIGILLLSLFAVPDDPTLNWEIFARVKFDSKYYQKEDEYFLVPVLDSRIKGYQGKEFTLRGYYMPMELENVKAIILSKFPYSQCFFCGGAGPESVAEVIFSSKRPRLKPDQIVTVTGILKLNDKDINHLNFILKDAMIESK